MGCLRAATPGFLVTLVATALLAVVVFSVPYLTSIWFLKASVNSNGVSGEITFGTLGYCSTIGGGQTCSSPSVGYELDINSLVGNNSRFQIPQVVVKWVTYALVLHIAALILAAIAAFFGLLAHIREFTMTCLSSCISGFAAAIALLAFVFDLVFFFLAKSRINAVEGGSAEIGNAVWLTLAAWILLFFSGCFYTIGRCCGSNSRGKDSSPETGRAQAGYPDQMRMDAIRAEVDRKTREKQSAYSNLPAFPEHQPLKSAYARGNDILTEEELARLEEEERQEAIKAERDRVQRQQSTEQRQNSYSTPGGYVRGPPGQRAIDDYNNPPHSNTASIYSNPSDYPPEHNQAQPPSHDPYYSHQNQGLLAAGPPVPPGMHREYSSASQQDYANQYGHQGGGTTYHSAVSTPTPYDPYEPDYGQNNQYGPPHDAGPQYDQHHQYAQGDPQSPEQYHQTGLLAAAGLRPPSNIYDIPQHPSQYGQPSPRLDNPHGGAPPSSFNFQNQPPTPQRGYSSSSQPYDVGQPTSPNRDYHDGSYASPQHDYRAHDYGLASQPSRLETSYNGNDQYRGPPSPGQATVSDRPPTYKENLGEYTNVPGGWDAKRR